MVSGMGGICLSVIYAQITTRAQAIAAINEIQELFGIVTTTLDESQTNFENQDIDKQYFSQSENYSNLARLVSATLEFLNSKLFELKIEKRFTLDKPKIPEIVTIEEYKDPEFLDFFIDTNNLKHNDLILLPTGKEVVIYV